MRADLPLTSAPPETQDWPCTTPTWLLSLSTMSNSPCVLVLTWRVMGSGLFIVLSPVPALCVPLAGVSGLRPTLPHYRGGRSPLPCYLLQYIA